MRLFMKKALYKVPNGKLLKIFLEDKDGKIITIKITGDFFVYPEEAIEALEIRLKNAPLTKESLMEIVSHFLKESSTNFFGLDTESLVTTILNAVESPSL